GLGEPRLHAVDDAQRVLALAHDHDAAHHFALPVQLGDAAALLGAEMHLAQVAHGHGHAVGAGHDGHARHIGDRADVAAAAHEVFVLGDLDHAAAHVVVRALQRIRHHADRHVVVGEPHGIEIHLVLAHEAADRRHLGHALHRLQPVAKRPVLEGAHAGQIVAPGCVHERVFEYPAHARGIGTEPGLDAFREP